MFGGDSGKEWNASTPKSSCTGENQPILASVYPGGSEAAVAVVRKVLAKMSIPVTLLDATTLSQLRQDGHLQFMARREQIVVIGVVFQILGMKYCMESLLIR